MTFSLHSGNAVDERPVRTGRIDFGIFLGPTDLGRLNRSRYPHKTPGACSGAETTHWLHAIESRPGPRQGSPSSYPGRKRDEPLVQTRLEDLDVVATPTVQRCPSRGVGYRARPRGHRRYLPTSELAFPAHRPSAHRRRFHRVEALPKTSPPPRTSSCRASANDGDSGA